MNLCTACGAWIGGGHKFKWVIVDEHNRECTMRYDGKYCPECGRKISQKEGI